MSTASAPEHSARVPGELHYLAPGSTVLRRFTAPGASINTGSYEPHTVPIRHGRPMQDNCRTDLHRFEIVSHRSAVSEFTDKAEVDAGYIPEAIEFVKERTGADEVVSRGAALRRSPSATFAVSETSRDSPTSCTLSTGSPTTRSPRSTNRRSSPAGRSSITARTTDRPSP